MKKKIIIFVMLTLVLALSACSSGSEFDDYVKRVNNSGEVHVSWDKSYEKLDELLEASDLIILGKVVSLVPEKRIDLVFTKEIVEVKKVLKGDIQTGDTVEVLFTGGELDGMITAPIEGAPLMDLKNSYVLFLELTEEGHYLIAGGYQGYSKVTNNEFNLSKVNKNDQKLKKIKIMDIEKMLRDEK